MVFIVVGLIHTFLPSARWLMVHVFALGALANSVMLWSQHFTERFLRAIVPADRRRGQLMRIGVLNAAIVVTIVGMLADLWTVTLIGAVLVGTALAWHALALLTQILRAHRAGGPAPSGPVWFYVASALMLPLGAGLGATIAHGPSEPWYSRFLVAHQAVNLLGFIGLAAAGTLFWLAPRLLGFAGDHDPSADGAEAGPAARPPRPALVLTAMLAGITALTASALAGITALAVIGAVVILLGWAGLPAALWAARPPRPWTVPSVYAAGSVTAALVWLLGALIGLAVILASGVESAGRFPALTVPLLVGFGAQLLFGVMTYLLPALMGGGGPVSRAGWARMDLWAGWRLIVINGGLLMWITPLPSWTKVFASALAMVGLVLFLPAMILGARAAMGVRRAQAAAAQAASTDHGDQGGQDDGAGDRPATDPVPAPDAAPARAGLGVQAAVGLACLALVAALGVSIGGPASTGDAAGGVTPTGRTVEVDIEAEDMRFTPDRIEVDAGDEVVLHVTNADDQVHDLVLESGQDTGRLSPGQSATLDVGVVGRDLNGWCSIAGHRQQGMVFAIDVRGGADGGAAESGHGTAGAGAPDSIAPAEVLAALGRDPGPDFEPVDAHVEPAPAGRTHEYTFEVTEVPGEYAPGLEQVQWTYNGGPVGPTLRGRIGDVFEVTLVNNGTMGHSIDFHAGQNAPDEVMRTIEPGESLVYRFTARRAGAWLYHCSTEPMTAHIAAGMFGAVIIDPDDLAPADAEFALVQSEGYLGAPGGEVDAGKARADEPDLLMFNGYALQYVHRPLTVRTGERVRIWVVDAGPNRSTAFHVIGGQFDTVFKDGAYLVRPGRPGAGGSQVLDIAPGQGGVVELEFDEPGTYPFVTHHMADAERGAQGLIHVTE